MIRIKNLSKSIDQQPILKGIELHVPNGQMLALIGESGHGKTTLMRCVQGLETYEGEIMLNGACGFVFQDYHLFNNFSIFENLTYAPSKVHNVRPQIILDKFYHLLEHFKLTDKLKSYPHKLSGGQKQRVAIIRALMMEPKVLLLDEPISALNPEMAVRVLETLKGLTENGLTIMMVTHQVDLVEPFVDRLITIHEGQIVQERTLR